MTKDMLQLSEFIKEHLYDDPTRLILNKEKYPNIDINSVVNTIISRGKIKNKLPDWYKETGLILKFPLSAEQCSSQDTALAKQRITSRLPHRYIADLTGGLGVDSYYFSQIAEKILYNEMNEELCESTKFNFNLLGVNNVEFCKKKIEKTACLSLFSEHNNFKPDIIYLDPARRSTSGKKVFLLEDCSPDVLQIKDELLDISNYLIIKLSPMVDIKMVLERLGNQCEELHILGSKKECKELIVVMNKHFNGECSIIVNNFKFKFSQENAATANYATSMPKAGDILLEPCKSLMKSGAYNMISQELSLLKLGKSTHYYITDSSYFCLQTSNANIDSPILSTKSKSHTADEKSNILNLFKTFEVIETLEFNKKSLKELSQRYSKAEITARNLHISSDELRKKLVCSSGGDIHIFALHHDKLNKDLLIVSMLRS